MINASLPPESVAILSTTRFRVPISPSGCAPQSISTCSRLPATGNETRKQSPNPTRYMRMRMADCVFASVTGVDHLEIHLVRQLGGIDVWGRRRRLQLVDVKSALLDQAVWIPETL